MKRAAFLFGLCAAVLTAVLCGCIAPDPEGQLFNRVASELDAGGSYYAVQNPVHLKQALSNLRKNMEEQLWKLPLPQAKAERFQMFLSGAELFFRTSGIAEIQGSGASSFRLAKNCFLNRMFWALPDKPQGVLWQLLPEENTLSVSELENLPENTAVAGVLKLAPQTLEKKLKTLYPEAKAFLSLPLLKELNGIWRFALILDPECDPQTGRGIHLMIAVPDPQKKVFNQLASILQLMPKSKVDRKNSRITVGTLLKKAMQPCCIQKDGNLFFYSSLQAEKLFTNPGKRLKESHDFQLASLLFHRPCAGAFYVQSSENLRALKGGLQLDCGFDDHCSVGILERKAGGLKWSSCDPWDWNVSFLQSLLAPASMLIEPLLLAPDAKAEEPEGKEDPQNLNADIPPLNPAKCEKHLKTLYNALNAYKKAHKNYPAAPGIPGLRELQKEKYITAEQLICPAMDIYSPAVCVDNCVYLYFGIPESPESPLLMERPCNHGRNCLSVCLANGTVKSFFMEKPFNIRKAVSFLHTQYHYEEKEFMRLMELAAEFDKIPGF